eukprot:12318807-Alexandrium_andersonii.AAC.1
MLNIVELALGDSPVVEDDAHEVQLVEAHDCSLGPQISRLIKDALRIADEAEVGEGSSLAVPPERETGRPAPD